MSTRKFTARITITASFYIHDNDVIDFEEAAARAVEELAQDGEGPLPKGYVSWDVPTLQDLKITS